MLGASLHPFPRTARPALSLAAVALFGTTLALPALAGEIFVTLDSPMAGTPVFGEVEVLATVSGDEPVAEVVLSVDGKARGRLQAPPFRWLIDVGQENSEHVFEVVARGRAGSRSTTSIKTPPIQIDDEVAVELQQLYVTVTDGGRRVLDLDQGDFRVYDDGKRQEVVTFARGDVAVAAVLLLDSSESMAGERIRAALSGAGAFVDGMRERDEVALLLFSDRLIESTPFTNRPEVLRDALSSVEAQGDTSINDHLYLALKLLDARQGRRVVVLFTDGADIHSVLDMDEVLWKARRSQALIYWIRLEPDRGHTSFATAWRNAEENKRQIDTLEKTVEQSGGRTLVIQDVRQIEPAFRDILGELREQYVLGYYPSQVLNDESWHDVNVRVERGGVRVRTRGGYVDH